MLDGERDRIIYQTKQADEWKEEQNVACKTLKFHELNQFISQFKN